jgi:hypothetical protein
MRIRNVRVFLASSRAPTSDMHKVAAWLERMDGLFGGARGPEQETASPLRSPQ